MQYRALKEQDVGVLTRIFSIPEYDMYFAENDTTEEEWKERLPLFETEHSYIVSEHGSDIGWIMYSICGAICSVDIVVLLPKERNKGYGKAIFQDLMARHPQKNHKTGCAAAKPVCDSILSKAGISDCRGRNPICQRRACAIL